MSTTPGRRGLVIGDVGTLAMMITVQVGILVLIGLGRISWEEADVPVTAIFTYLFGGGVNAVRGRAPSAVILPRLAPDEFATTTGVAPVEQEGTTQ